MAIPLWSGRGLAAAIRGSSLHALGAAVLLFVAAWIARRSSGLAATCLGAGVGVALVGFGLRDEPWLGQVTISLLCALIARGVWGETELRRQLVTSRAAAVQLEQHLQHAERLRTVGDVAALVAHRLRNDLQVIDGVAALGSTDADNGSAGGRFATIRTATQNAAGVVQQLLGLAHPSIERPKAFDLVAHVELFAARMRAILPERVDLVVDPTDGGQPVWVVLDGQGLDDVLLNLVMNAKDAMPQDGGEIRFRIAAENGKAVLEVRDSGVGMEPSLLRRVFDPYVTTKPKGEGTGLGLVAVRRFVEAVGGELRVERAVGHGTSFVLVLPLGAPPRADARVDRGDGES